MKWQHKKIGWIAQTYEYCDIQHLTSNNIKDASVYVFRKLDNGEQANLKMPISWVLDDEDWYPIQDDRWTEYRFTIREFMQAFSWVILDNHDAEILKSMADNELMKQMGLCEGANWVIDKIKNKQ